MKYLARVAYEEEGITKEDWVVLTMENAQLGIMKRQIGNFALEEILELKPFNRMRADQLRAREVELN